jgi:hypothetical protein
MRHRRLPNPLGLLLDLDVIYLLILTKYLESVFKSLLLPVPPPGMDV